MMRHRRSATGLFEKYRVARIDGKPVGWCFVLEGKDPAALVALRAYERAVRITKPDLARDLRARILELSRGVADA